MILPMTLNILCECSKMHKKYVKTTSANSAEFNEWMRTNEDGSYSMYTEEEFAKQILKHAI